MFKDRASKRSLKVVKLDENRIVEVSIRRSGDGDGGGGGAGLIHVKREIRNMEIRYAGLPA